jgi:hypothetical protein
MRRPRAHRARLDHVRLRIGRRNVSFVWNASDRGNPSRGSARLLGPAAASFGRKLFIDAQASNYRAINRDVIRAEQALHPRLGRYIGLRPSPAARSPLVQSAIAPRPHVRLR